MSQAGRPRSVVASRSGRTPIVPWPVRAAELVRRAREHARERHGAALDAWVALRFPQAAEPAPAERDGAVDEFLLLEGTAEGAPSALREFAEGAEDLRPEERAQVLRWEKERRRGVYLLEHLVLEHLAADGVREFLLVAAPLPITGASGSPVCPVAIA